MEYARNIEGLRPDLPIIVPRIKGGHREQETAFGNALRSAANLAIYFGSAFVQTQNGVLIEVASEIVLIVAIDIFLPATDSVEAGRMKANDLQQNRL